MWLKWACWQEGFYQSRSLKGDYLFLLAGVIFQISSQEKSNSFKKQIHRFQQFLFNSEENKHFGSGSMIAWLQVWTALGTFTHVGILISLQQA